MGGDGEATQVHWFHPSCAFRMLKRARKDTKKIEEEDTLRNFEEMKSDDQAYLRKLIAGEQLWEVSGPPPADRLKPINPPKPKAEKTTKSAAKRKIPANQVQEVDSAAKRAKTTGGGSGSSPSLWQKLTSQELSFGLSWAQTPDATCAYLHSASLPGSAKIASFDMDSTLISTKSGAKFPKHAGDWQWWSGSVVKTLQKYHAEGYKLVIFTNQGQAIIAANRLRTDHCDQIMLHFRIAFFVSWCSWCGKEESQFEGHSGQDRGPGQVG